jgi:putative DeoR family transcriptional regulator (stage III sporulation protein D)
MKQHIILRTLRLADYILETGATVRDASKRFGVSKSTVHKDVSERLKQIDPYKYDGVKKISDFNLSERHLRGGNATKRKYGKV